MMKRRIRCSNLNHSRLIAPVRCCAMCGEVVNGNIISEGCIAYRHALQRCKGSTYCVNCGQRLSTWT